MALGMLTAAPVFAFPAPASTCHQRTSDASTATETPLEASEHPENAMIYAVSLTF